MAVAVGLLVVGYFINNSNCQLFWDEKQMAYSLFQKMRSTKVEDEHIFENALFVDVSNAKTMLDRRIDPNEYPDREIVTNREILMKFLQKVENQNYNYLFLDIEFKDGSSSDITLVEQLLKMQNVSIGKLYHNDTNSPNTHIDKRLDSIAFFTNCPFQPYDTRFQKYEYIQHGENSIALEMYRHETGTNPKINGEHTIKEKGLLYFDFNNESCFLGKWRLANNLIALSFNYTQPSFYDIEYLLQDSDEWNTFSSRINGRKIIIGDFKYDKVCTYMGELPGPVVNWIAYMALINGKHKVDIWCTLFLFGVYFLITMYTIQKKAITEIISNILSKSRSKKHALIKTPIVQFIGSFIGYGAVLFILSLVLYLICDKLYSLILPTIVFPIIKNGVQFYDNKKNYEN